LYYRLKPFLVVILIVLAALGTATLLHAIFPVAPVSVYNAAICLPLAYGLARQRRRVSAVRANQQLRLQIEIIILALVITPLAAIPGELFPAWDFWIFTFAMAAYFLAGAWRDRKIDNWLGYRPGPH
jgi:peptidoglycan/LPS O-acetylase OafA/YrhL